jgi:hypothetical protein
MPSKPLGIKPKVIKRNNRMENPATITAANDRKTFSESIHRELDKLSVAKAMAELNNIQEPAEFPEAEAPIEEGRSTPETRAKALAKADRQDKAAAERMKKRGSASFINVRTVGEPRKD